MWARQVDPQRLSEAVGLAADLHRDQLRKGTEVPYLAHLLAVAALVAEDLGSEDTVLAGLLHDAAEDQGGRATLRLIERRLGPEVARLVEECSDSLLEKNEEKAPWEERKRAAVHRVADHSEEALLIIAADKLHNTRTTVTDVSLFGNRVWDRFKTGRDGFEWYHREMVAALRSRIPESRSVRMLERELALLVSLD